MNKADRKSFFCLFSLLAIAIAFSQCNPKDYPLYQSEAFRVYPNRVEQGEYTAVAESKTLLRSRHPDAQKEWTLQRDVSRYPAYESNQVLLDALYLLSLEELEACRSEDSVLHAAKEHKTLRTRDVAYSVLLSLAIVAPEWSKKNLLARVKHGKIIQDLGTGGSWPVSSDRMVWSAAAWEVFLVTGDVKWLKKAYFIIKNSTEDDLNVVWDYQKHLFRGEVSFPRRQEQSYPGWMEAADIYNSYSLNTQAVHYRSLQVLIQMGMLLGKDVEKYKHISEALQKSIAEQFWLPEKGYYGQLLYGKQHHSLSERSESLGESLLVLWDLVPFERQQEVVANTPVCPYGVPSFYPQIPSVAANHNNANRPLVQAFYNWASAKTQHAEAVQYGLACLLRPTALFVSNKNILSPDNGTCKDTTNRHDEHLLNIAGSLSGTFRVLLGLQYKTDQLEIHPFIPRAYKGRQSLTGLRYQKAILDIEVYGFGSKISSYSVDGVPYRKPVIPKEMEGRHQITIMMNNQLPTAPDINLRPKRYSPPSTSLSYSNKHLQWQTVANAAAYRVFKNGELLLDTKDTNMSEVQRTETAEFQVQSIDSAGMASFLSEPVLLFEKSSEQLLEAESFSLTAGGSFVAFTRKKNREFYFQAKVKQAGMYRIDFLYANGNGPADAGDKCALRSFWVNNAYAGTLVFPQRGLNNWLDYGYSNSCNAELKKGRNLFKISFENFNNNMNVSSNAFRMDKIRLIRL